MMQLNESHQEDISTEIKTKVLFIGESVSLAHITRPHELARHLDPKLYEIHFSSGIFHPFIKKIKQATYHLLSSLSSKEFYHKITKGKPIYDQQTIKSYVQAELKLISKIAPDIIIADNRPTLQISAALTGIPFVNLCNAHWSPYSTLSFPIPDIPLTRLYGENLSKLIIPKITPVILKQHTRAFREIQKRWGLQPVKSIQEMYTGGTRTAYFDIPELSPTKKLPKTHSYLGPILWEPTTQLKTPFTKEKTTVYLSMGSSGDQSLTELLATNLIDKGYQVICSGVLPNKKGLISSELIPGIQASLISDFVICHGGSGTIYQALSAGKPLIGLCNNADQQFVMQGVEKFGAGISIKSRRANTNNLMIAIEKIQSNSSYKNKALTASNLLKQTQVHIKFKAILNELKPSKAKRGALV